MQSELIGPTEPFDHGLSAPTGEPSPGPKRSVFREMPWRWSDVIVGFGHKPVATIDDLQRLLSNDCVGVAADVEFVRATEILTLRVTPTESPKRN